MAAKAVIPFLVAMMLLTGVCNTLLTKYQDMQCVRGCADPDPKRRKYFEQPVIQTLQMFIGEMGCWLVVGGAAMYDRYYRRRRREGYESLPAEGEGEGEGVAEEARTGVAAAADGPAEEDEDETLGSSSASGTESPNPLAKSLTASELRVHLGGWKVMLLALPACCDIAGTTLMNVGLLFVAASIYQMTRGALVLFVGLFSVLFLKRRLGGWKWVALVIVVAGVALVGLAGAISQDDKATPSAVPDGGMGGGDGMVALMPSPKDTVDLLRRLVRRAAADAAAAAEGEGDGNAAVQTVVGVLLIALAQIFTASQFVLEESIMEKYSIEPLKAVGWEGIWGFLVTLVGMIVLHLAYGRTDAGRFGYFDAREGLWEITHYRAIAVSSVLIMISIGGFNFFGLSVTRTVSATSRSTIDTCRTLFIWIVSLGLGWETFKWLQVVGFALLVYGTFLFNDIVRPPLQSWLRRRRGGLKDMLPETLGEHS